MFWVLPFSSAGRPMPEVPPRLNTPEVLISGDLSPLISAVVTGLLAFSISA